MGRMSSGVRHESVVVEEGQMTAKVKAEDFHEMEEDLSDCSWLQGLPLQESTARSSDEGPTTAKVASDVLLGKVQDAYDAFQHASSGLRNCCMQLRGKIDQATVMGGLEKAKTGFATMDMLEKYLIEERSNLSETQIRGTLVEVAREYQGLKLKQMEMQTLHKQFVLKKALPAPAKED